MVMVAALQMERSFSTCLLYCRGPAGGGGGGVRVDGHW